MRFEERFERKVRTTRRLVLENIMDLDHVCVVHRRWFRDLRIRTWRPDFVDYLLRSRFHGLDQEVRVRGGPVDEDRYWYEFDGPLARIRVDGTMEGPDGDLLQTETITYEFAWILAPFFAALKPLFQRQKEDILRDDTRMLEREHELDRSGFRRDESAGRLPRVVVYGGAGFFGSLVVRDLLRRTRARVAVVSRGARSSGFEEHGPRVHHWHSDLADPAAARALVGGAAAVVNAAGPFQGMSLALLEACIDARVPYVDVADDREFIERAHGLHDRARAAGVPVLSGCSVVPGMSSILLRACLDRLPGADRVLVCISPGTGRPRGFASFECLLSTVNRSYEVPDGKGTRTVRGWTEGEVVEFPPAVGRRSVHSVVDVGDYFTAPLYFGPRAITFKIGAELALLNGALTAWRIASAPLGPGAHRPLVPLFRAFVGFAALFGSTQGGVVVRAEGGPAGARRRVALCMSRARDGHVIPAILPAVAVGRILEGRAPEPGLVDLSRWLSIGELDRELRLRGVDLSLREEPGSGWMPWSPAAGTPLDPGDPGTDPDAGVGWRSGSRGGIA